MGVLRDPGETTAWATPSRTHSSTSVAQKVAVVAGVVAIPSIVASMRIEIFSDVICPWCFIGKRRFETAISRLRDRGVDVQVDYVFRPFQLDPTAPTDSPTPSKDAYAKKFGGVEKATEILNHVTSVAAQDNITFNMDGANMQIMLKELLMDAYFTNGKNIGDVEVLADCAESAGMSRQDALVFLQGDDLADEVRTEIAEAAEYGVTAGPTFIINGQWSVPGAQDGDMFERIIERILERA